MRCSVTEHLYNSPGGVDVARWPLVRIRPPSGVSADGGDLEAFCRELEAHGIKLDRPYGKLPSGFGLAFLTDPWGTYVELTEGLRAL